MALNLYDKKVVDNLVQTVADIRRQLRDSRTNQVNRLEYGNVVIDGDDNSIQILDNSDNVIILLDEMGMTIKGQSSSNDYITFKYLDDEDIALFNFKRATSGGYDISEFDTKVIAREDDDRITYWTAQIDTNAGVRDIFLQMNSRYDAGVFTDASINWSKDGQLGTFTVYMSDSSGNGYMDIPKKSSDPSGNARRMYYNTTLNRFRIYDGRGWKNANPEGWNGGVTVNTPFGVQTWTFVDGCLTNIV